MKGRTENIARFEAQPPSTIEDMPIEVFDELYRYGQMLRAAGTAINPRSSRGF